MSREPGASGQPRPGHAPRITVVRTPACHLCEDAERALAEIGREHPLVVDRVDARSPEGGELMRAHRAAMSPLVLVDGRFFSSGRLPRGKLRTLLVGLG